MTTLSGPRSRERGGLLSVQPQRASYWWNTSQNPKPAPVFTVLQVDLTQEWINDVVVPNYKLRSAKGEIFNNPMDRARVTQRYGQRGPIFRSQVGAVVYWGDMIGPWDTTLVERIPDIMGVAPTDWMPYLEDARNNALAKVTRPDISGLTILGEARETLKMLMNPLKGGLKLAQTLERDTRKALKQPNRRTGLYSQTARKELEQGIRYRRQQEHIRNYELDAAKDLAGIYAEFRFGIKPFLMDMEKVLLELQAVHMPKIRQTFRSRLEVPEFIHSGSYPVTIGQISATGSYTYTRSAFVSAGLLYELEQGLKSTEETWGLRLSDLPKTAWELIPLSFMVDRFTSIGKVLDALQPVANMNRLASWSTVSWEERVERTTRQWLFNVAGWSTATDGAGSDTWERVYFKRTPRPFGPTLKFASEGIMPALTSDALRVVDLLALSLQRVKRL